MVRSVLAQSGDSLARSSIRAVILAALRRVFTALVTSLHALR